MYLGRVNDDVNEVVSRKLCIASFYRKGCLEAIKSDERWQRFAV